MTARALEKLYLCPFVIPIILLIAISSIHSAICHTLNCQFEAGGRHVASHEPTWVTGTWKLLSDNLIKFEWSLMFLSIQSCMWSSVGYLVRFGPNRLVFKVLSVTTWGHVSPRAAFYFLSVVFGISPPLDTNFGWVWLIQKSISLKDHLTNQPFTGRLSFKPQIIYLKQIILDFCALFRVCVGLWQKIFLI